MPTDTNKTNNISNEDIKALVTKALDPYIDENIRLNNKINELNQEIAELRETISTLRKDPLRTFEEPNQDNFVNEEYAYRIVENALAGFNKSIREYKYNLGYDETPLYQEAVGYIRAIKDLHLVHTEDYNELRDNIYEAKANRTEIELPERKETSKIGNIRMAVRLFELALRETYIGHTIKRIVVTGNDTAILVYRQNISQPKRLTFQIKRGDVLATFAEICNALM